MTKPNILLILTDDQRYDTLSALGHEHVHTPNLDRLVERGTTFERCHIMGGSVPAVCCPSRAMLHTGRGLFEIDNHGKAIPDKHALLGEYLRNHDYTSYGTGKWHNGTAAYNRSFDDGGTIFFGGMADHWHVPCHDYDPTGAYAGNGHIRKGAHSTTRITAEAVEIVRRHDQSQPFFCSVAYLAPHDPRTMPEEFKQRQMEQRPSTPVNFAPEHPFDHGDLHVRDELLADLPRRPDEIKRHIAEYYAMIDHLDWSIGRLIDALESTGQLDNTLIVVSGDNGLAVGQHGLMGKQSCYDHSLRVPLIFAGPGVPVGERRQQLCYLHDVFPTLCDVVGGEAPASVTAHSLWPTITANAAHRPSLYCGYRARIRSLTRDDGWKLICSDGVDGIQREQLFDLKADPNEMTNLAGDHRFQAQRDDLWQRLAAAHAASCDQWEPLTEWQGVPA